MIVSPSKDLRRLIPLKHLCTLNPEVLPETTDPDFTFEYIDIGNVSLEKGVESTSSVRFQDAPSRARRAVRKGDTLISTVRTYLKAIAYIDDDHSKCIVSTGFAVLRPWAGVDPQFLYRAAQSRHFVDSIVAASTGVSYPAITPSVLGVLKIPLPQLDVQKKIVRFLEEETASIDELITKKLRLLELLTEKLQAGITSTVLNGAVLSRGLSQGAGAEWFGPVPRHWEILKTKRVFRLTCRPAPDDNDAELLSVYTEIGVRPRKELEQRGNKASTTDGYWIVQKGDIIVNKLLAWMGAIGYSAYDGVTSPAYDILRPIRPLEPKFYHYLFRSQMAQRELKRWSRGIMDMRLRLYFSELGNLLIPVPPIGEQQEIVQKIEELEQKHVLLTDKATRHIKLINEYRERLISAAVTGEIDVVNWRKRGSMTRHLENLEKEAQA